MFLGHFGVALAAKRIDPRVSLATAFAAAQLPDLIWPGLVLAGVERVTIAPGDTAVTPLRFDSYPFSHSLLMVALWAAAGAGLHFARKRRRTAAFVLGGLVLSHWVLDFASHRPDMPIAPGLEVRLGLGLWNSVPGTLAVEALLFGGGLALLLSATRARDAAGRWGLASLLATLVLLYVASVFGPPPPSAPAVAWTGVVGAIVFTAWAAWADRHREAS